MKLPLIVDNIKELNTKVDLSIKTSPLDEAFAEPSYFKKFDLIIATELSKTQIINLNEISRRLNIPLYVGGMHGLFGYILVDLIEHTSYNEYNQSSVPRKVNVELSRNKTMIAVKPDPLKKVDIVTIRDVYSHSKLYSLQKKWQDIPVQEKYGKRLYCLSSLHCLIFHVLRIQVM